MTRTVHVVDDDDAVRSSVQALLSLRPNLIVRGFRSGDAFLAAADQIEPGVVLLDHHMPGASGLDVLRALAPLAPRFAPIILTGQGSIQLSVQAMKAGALDFLEKPYQPGLLLDTIDRTFGVFEQHAAAAARREDARNRLARLSPRETEVLMGLIEGQPNKIIAHELSLSPRTVEIYRANLMDKLEVKGLSEALRLAFAAGLIAID